MPNAVAPDVERALPTSLMRRPQSRPIMHYTRFRARWTSPAACVGKDSGVATVAGTKDVCAGIVLVTPGDPNPVTSSAESEMGIGVATPIAVGEESPARLAPHCAHRPWSGGAPLPQREQDMK